MCNECIFPERFEVVPTLAVLYKTFRRQGIGLVDDVVVVENARVHLQFIQVSRNDPDEEGATDSGAPSLTLLMSANRSVIFHDGHKILVMQLCNHVS
jgi:hypothetical protein